ncbi:FAD-binding oxidoreductase [Saccharothrix obliqua]|uniref:FAD-binding oxidoreductase n=1 Tax=Saccharothrix obliqua TaxID=2861747 RepID=UPI001C5EC7F4|nr:FAD-binding oxidoreductase [Saccharothrix obliqua]MBW4722008.1 FAD-binding oxidoreductase [Saccharothrix obliqua]
MSLRVRVEDLAAIVGAAHVVTDDVPARHTQDLWGSDRVGHASVVVRPADAAEVAAVLAHCHGHHQPVAVQGGMTGLVGGAVPGADEVVLSTERLAGATVDLAGRTVTAGAGATLGDVQDLAAEHGFLLPIDLASKGSATIGGCVATNAGGVNVVGFGMTRQHVRSLEVALADGRVLTLSTPLVKDNAGMDLKQLFIGSEGLLGVVTSATLGLQPAALSRTGAFVALEDLDTALALLNALQRKLPGAVTAFEVMWDDAYRTLEPTGMRLPLPFGHPLYALVECRGADPAGDAERLAVAVAEFSDSLLDAAVATNAAELGAFWAARERIPAEILRMQPLFGFDVSVPAGALAKCLAAMRVELERSWPAVKLLVFGHLGDDNVHIAVVTGETTRERKPEVEHIVYRLVTESGGSISAEHGVGFEKRSYLGYTRSADEIALMRRLKELLDPRGILNRDRMIPWGGENA